MASISIGHPEGPNTKIARGNNGEVAKRNTVPTATSTRSPLFVAQGQLSSLSTRETEVLRLMTEGLGEKQIARTLNVSLNTARTYKARIFRKLDVKSSSEAIRWSFEHHLIDSVHGEDCDALQALSRREREVIVLLASGFRRREIADKLSISVSTVRSHLTRSFQKLGVRNARAVVSLALRAMSGVDAAISEDRGEHGDNDQR